MMLASLLSRLVPRSPPAASALCSTRGLRSQAGRYRQERVVTNSDGSVIACWHPEPKFPYEFTRPIPRTEARTDSALKVQHVEDMEELYHRKHERLQRRDLMRITWTTKHRWFPRPRKENAVRKPPRERPYL